MDPYIAVTSDRSTFGLSDIAELPGIKPLDAMPLSLALERTWVSDAHLLMYHATAPSGSPHYLRVNKCSPALAQLRAAGGDLKMGVVVFDFDRPKSNGVKYPWANMDEVDSFLGRVEHAVASGLPEPTAFYTTLHGARFVYALTSPVTPEYGEGLMHTLFQRFKAGGIELDEACKDWSRLFRLPRVTRQDTARASDKDSSFLLLQGGPLLDPASVAGVIPVTLGRYDSLESVGGDLPTLEECYTYLWESAPTGRERLTEWHKEARKWLRGRESFAVAFEQVPWDSAKGRDNEITRLVGQAVGMLYGRVGASPEGVFALFSEALEQLTPDADTPDWRQKAWEITRRLWAYEGAQRTEALVRHGNLKRLGNVTWSRLLAILSKTYPEQPELQPDEAGNLDDDAAREWVLGRAIAAAPKGGLFLLQPDGSYSTIPISPDLLQASIRHDGMAEFIETQELRGKELKLKSAQNLIDHHAIVVERVECTPNTAVSRIVTRGEQKALVIKCHKVRADLGPVRDDDVEEWLMELGGEFHHELLDWLSHSVSVGRAICALLLVGSPSAGKQMLVQGLAECFEDPHANVGDKAISRFNTGLVRNPIVHFDEGIPRDQREGRSTDELLRALISGGDMELEPKGLATIHALIYPRVIITANNIEIMSQICGRRDLSDDDLAGLSQRLLYIPVRDNVVKWLAKRGNYAFTRGWIAGDSENRYRLAKHILWLHEHRNTKTRGDNRLLVEGQKDNRLMQEYSTRTPVARATLRSLIEMIEAPVRAPQWNIVVHDGAVYTIPSGVLWYYERNLQTYMRDAQMNVRSIGRVLRLVSLNKGREATVRNVPGQPDGAVRHRWWQIDLRAILRESIAGGYDRKRLEEIFLVSHTKQELEQIMSAVEVTKSVESDTIQL